MGGTISHLQEDPCDHFFSVENIQSLTDQGHLILDNVLSANLISLLGQHSLSLRTQGLFKPAGIARGKNNRIAKNIRSDTICWWDPFTPILLQQRFWRFMNQLRLQLNRHLFLGLVDAELHYAIYPYGAFYGKHLDQFRSSNLRKISMVLFLNDMWTDADGGQLRLYEDDGIGFLNILPKGGTLALFFSDRVLHEALPTYKERLSLTGWFKVRA